MDPRENVVSTNGRATLLNGSEDEIAIGVRIVGESTMTAVVREGCETATSSDSRYLNKLRPG